MGAGHLCSTLSHHLVHPVSGTAGLRAHEGVSFEVCLMENFKRFADVPSQDEVTVSHSSQVSNVGSWAEDSDRYRLDLYIPSAE